MISLKKLLMMTAGAAFVALGNVGSAQAIILSNGSLTVDIRNDNGAIDSILFGGSDFYNSGTAVSDFGLQNDTNTSTFVLNDTNGLNGQPVTVIGTSSSVTVTGTYTKGGANINFNRTYSLVSGQNVLRTATVFTNSGPNTTLSYFDSFDPDQGIDKGLGAKTFNDVFNLATGAGTAKVGQASISTGLTVVIGSVNPNVKVTVASGEHFLGYGIGSGSELNNLFLFSDVAGDGNGTFEDMGTFIGIRESLTAGSTRSFVYDQAYGTSVSDAQAAFKAANLSAAPVPFEFSPGLGILALGACSAITQLKSQGKKRKFSGSI